MLQPSCFSRKPGAGRWRGAKSGHLALLGRQDRVFSRENAVPKRAEAFFGDEVETPNPRDAVSMAEIRIQNRLDAVLMPKIAIPKCQEAVFTPDTAAPKCPAIALGHEIDIPNHRDGLFANENRILTVQGALAAAGR